jgi:hypothetical protein
MAADPSDPRINASAFKLDFGNVQRLPDDPGYRYVQDLNSKDWLRLPDYQYRDDQRRAEMQRMAEASANDAQQPDDGTTLADYFYDVMKGASSLVSGVGWMLDRVPFSPLSFAGKTIQGWGDDAADYWDEKISPSHQAAKARQFIRRGEDGSYEWGDANLETVLGFIAESIPGTVGGFGAGAVATKGLTALARGGLNFARGAQMLSNPVFQRGLQATIKAGEGAAAGSAEAVAAVEAARSLKLANSVLGAAGFGLGEGIVAAPSAAAGVERRVRNLPLETLAQSERWQEIYASADDMPEAERQRYATDTVAREAGTQAGWQSGLTTALLGAPFGTYFGRLLNRDASSAIARALGKAEQTATGRMVSGALAEGAQEFLQSGSEQLLSNLAVGIADPNQDPLEDVLNQAVGGMAAGMGMGGTFAAVHGPQNPAAQSEDDSQFPPIPEPQFNPDAPRLPAPEGYQPQQDAPADWTVGRDGAAQTPEQAARARLGAPPPVTNYEVGADGVARRPGAGAYLALPAPENSGALAVDSSGVVRPQTQGERAQGQALATEQLAQQQDAERQRAALGRQETGTNPGRAARPVAGLLTGPDTVLPNAPMVVDQQGRVRPATAGEVAQADQARARADEMSGRVTGIAAPPAPAPIRRKSDGKPFKTRQAAESVRDGMRLTATHDVAAVEGGFELRPKAAAKANHEAVPNASIQTPPSTSSAPRSNQPAGSTADLGGVQAAASQGQAVGNDARAVVPGNAAPVSVGTAAQGGNAALTPNVPRQTADVPRTPPDAADVPRQSQPQENANEEGQPKAPAQAQGLLNQQGSPGESTAGAASEAAAQVPPFQNVIHDRPAIQVGRPNEDSHVSEAGWTYRTMSQAEIDDARERGSFRSRGGKSKGGRVNVKHWVRGGTGKFFRRGEGGGVLVRVRNENITTDQEVRFDDVEVRNEETGEFAPARQSESANAKPNSETESAPTTERGGATVVTDPNEFINAPDGSLDFGEITPEQAKIIGRQAGKIRLREGDETFGRVHIERRHGDQIRGLGFDSIERFVSTIARSFNAIYRHAGEGRALDVVLKDAQRGMLIVQLEPSADGDFYDVKTATPIRSDQFKNKKPLWERAGPSASSAEADPLNPKGQSNSDGTPLWDGSEPTSTAAGSQPLYAGAPDDGSGQGTPTAQGRSGEDSTPAAPAAQSGGAAAQDEPPQASRASPAQSQRIGVEAASAEATRILGVDRVGSGRKVQVVASGNDLPAGLKARMLAMGESLFDKKGVFWRGVAYIIADQHSGAAQIAETIFHEHFTHYGLRARYGVAHGKLLETLFQGVGGIDGVRRLAREQGINLSQYEDAVGNDPNLSPAQRRQILMEELMAHMSAATGRLRRIIEEFVGALRAFLRDNGYAELAEYGVTDLAHVMRQARQAAMSQGAAGQTAAEPMYQRVFHGTPNMIRERFQLNRIGTGEGNQRYGWGLYFANRREVAEYYRAIADDGGHLYSAEIPDDPALLDWDATLSQQPEGMVERLSAALQSDAVPDRALEDFGVSTRADLAQQILKPEFELSQVHGSLEDIFGSPQAVSEALRSAGIPGLRYKDQGSRNNVSRHNDFWVVQNLGTGLLRTFSTQQEAQNFADEQDQSHNYVIWDEAAIGDPEPMFSRSAQNQRGTTDAEVVEALDWLDTAAAVATMRGNELNVDQKITGLIDDVAAAWKRKLGDTNGVPRSEVGGVVVIDKKSAQKSLGHGAGLEKKKALYLVPEAMRAAKLLGRMPQVQGKPEAFVFAAPVGIGADTYRMYMEVRRDPNMTRLYLHEVVLRREGTDPAFEIPAAQREGQQQPQAAKVGALRSFLNSLREVKDRAAALDENTDTGPMFSRSEAPQQDPPGTVRSARAGLDAMGRTMRRSRLAAAKALITNKAADLRQYALGAFGGRQLGEMYGNTLPALRPYLLLAQKMGADAHEAAVAAQRLVDRWGKLPRKVADQLADLMHEATLAQTDADPKGDAGIGSAKQRMDLIRRFNALPEDAQAIYREARDQYKQHWDAVQTAISERIDRAQMSDNQRRELKERARQQFQKALKGVYFPLARFGEYIITVKNASGEVAASVQAETQGQAKAEREALLRQYPASQGYKVGNIGKLKQFNASRDSVSKDFVQQLFAAVDSTSEGVGGEALKDAINQLYLHSLPSLSWAKSGIHRKGTPGYSRDARRAFARNMAHGGRYLTRLRYTDRLEDQMRAMQQQVDEGRERKNFDAARAQDVVNEMVKRHELMLKPVADNLSALLTGTGFIWYLGATPAAAIVNLSQTPLFAMPMMGARYGFGNAISALTGASKEAAANLNDMRKGLKGDELEAFDRAVNDGTIEVTMAHDLAGVSAGSDQQVLGTTGRKVMTVASWMFHHAEKFNRQVTFMATYRLARQRGASSNEAFEQAREITFASHFDYSSANRPRLMQGNVARVVLLFKQYAQNIIYTLGSLAARSFKGDKEARKALSGILVMHALTAGALGLPVVGTILAIASALGDDDDEPWDAEVALRNYLAEAIGKKPAEILLKGLPRGFLPGDVAGRVGLDSLIMRDSPSLSGTDWYQATATSLLGPVVGIGLDWTKAAQTIQQGDIARGIEELLPKALKDAMKSVRFLDEGARDKTGVEILDDMSLVDALTQLSGFTPARLSEAYEGRSAVYQADRELQDRRQELLADLWRAKQRKNVEDTLDANNAILRFNNKNPTLKITNDSIRRSEQARRQRIREAQDGVYLPRNRRGIADLGNFAATN